MRVRAARIALTTATVIAALCGTVVHAGQRSGAQAPRREKAVTGSIGGTVVVQATGTPVARARVILTSTALTRSRVVLADPRGQFTFSGIAAGDYELAVMRSGYALIGRSRRGVPVRIGDGEQRTGVTLQLQRAGTIPGRVDDEDGSPLAGAQIEALSLRAVDGQRPLEAAAVTFTDDRGEFRLTGLAAGQYFVIARDTAFAQAGDDAGALRYPPTYFPGVVAEADATPVSVAAGGESSRVEFRLRIAGPAHVAGILRSPDKRMLTSGAVVLVPREPTAATGAPSEDVEIHPDGRFQFRNVPPGGYQLRARAATDPTQVLLFGSFALQVEPGRDVSDVSVTLAPGAVVHGQVEWIGDGAPSVVERGRLRVRAPFADGTSFGDALTGDVSRDGSFRLRGVMTGSHFFTIEGLPEAWGLSRVRIQGRESAPQPIQLHEGEQLQNVRLIVTRAATDVSGAITDADGRATPDALVVLTPSGARGWTGGDPRFHMTRADGAGRYRARRLPPGTYRVTALAGVDELAARRPDWLGRLEARGRSLVLADAAGPQTLDLVAVSPQALPAALSR